MVYVDPVFTWPIEGLRGQARRVAERTGGRWCHMWADTLEELHAMADQIGLRRAWFQAKQRFPHYDLTPRKREAALRAGAVEMGLGEYRQRRQESQR